MHVGHGLLIIVEIDGDKQREHHVKEIFVDVFKVFGNELLRQLRGRFSLVAFPVAVDESGDKSFEESSHHGRNHLMFCYKLGHIS